MKKKLLVGNAQAFWGDSPIAPFELLQKQPDLDFMTLDYLSEVSLSILAIQREKTREHGYARDFMEVVRALAPLWKEGSKCKIVTNAGGLNPLECAKACMGLLKQNGLDLQVGVVEGDDVLEELLRSPENPLYKNLDTDEPITAIKGRLITANAYLGAREIAGLLGEGADIVITGRVADPSLTVGPCVYHYHWDWDDYQKLAGATIAGHLIECGTQVTGGFSNHWLSYPSLENIGFPIAEIYEDGSCVITKPRNTGGKVSVETVKEQLLYEIGDPANYLSPDVAVSFLGLSVSEEGENRVKVSGAIGSQPTDSYKVSATCKDGFRAEAFLAFYGPQANCKARRAGEVIVQRVKRAGYELEKVRIECIGAGDIVPVKREIEVEECMLRVAAYDHREEALIAFSKEIAPLITNGPQGVTGYGSGRPQVRPVFGYWPCLIKKEKLSPRVKLLDQTGSLL